MKISCILPGLLCLCVCALAFELNDDFSRSDVDIYSKPSRAVFEKTGGISDSACAKFTYNGQNLIVTIPGGVKDQPITVIAKVKTDLKKNFFRLTFGNRDLAWNRFFGYGDADIGISGWQEIKMVIEPTPSRGGTYRFFVNGVEKRSGKFPSTLGPVERIAFRYQGNNADGAVLLDDLRIYTGKQAANPLKAGETWKEDFTELDMERIRPVDYPVILKNGGVDNSSCACFSYNGQTLWIPLASPLYDRPLTVTARIKSEASKAYFRFAFGDRKMDYRTHYGNMDFRQADGKWHDVKLVIIPNPVKGGKYQFFLDGKEVRKGNIPAASAVIEMLRFGYLGTGTNERILLDDLQVTIGDKLDLPPAETVIIKFAPPAERIFTASEGVIPFSIYGNADGLSDYRAEFFPNRKNFTHEAEKTPVGTATVRMSGDNRGEVSFSDLPFGYHVVAISACTADGKRHVLRKDYLARHHGTPPKAADYPIRWAIDSHIDRAFWKQELEALKLAGVNWTRLEMNMDSVTPETPGVIHFDHHDKVIDEAAKMGINVFFLINCKPKWSGITPLSNNACLPDVENYKKACRMIMKRYAGKVRFFEIYNEPQHYNWSHFEPGVINEEHYGKLLLAAQEVAAEISPDIVVMGPCLTANMTEWIFGINRVNGFSKSEYLTYHDNSFPDYRGQFYLSLVEKVSGKKLKPFVTESSNDPRRLIASFAGETPSASFGYTIFDKGTSENNYEHFNGMMRQDGIPKERFIKYQYMAHTLNQARYIGRIFTAEGLNGYLFENKGEYLAAVWPGSNTRLPDVAFAPGVKRMDLIGNPFEGKNLRALDPRDQYYYSMHHESLIFLRNLPADAKEIIAANVNCDSDYKLFEPGPDKKLGITFQNTGRKPRTYNLQLKNGNGLEFPETLTVSVKPGEKLSRELALTALPTAPAAEIYIDAVLTVDGDKLARRFGPIRILAPERVKNVKIWEDKKANPLSVPSSQVDIHVGHSTGVAREKQDVVKNSRGSNASVVTLPDGREVARVEYVFTSPKDGWKYSIWRACRYHFKKPIPLPGIPIKISYDVFMEDNIKHYPTIPTFLFKDPTGKELRIEAANVFFSGWKRMECYLPSLYSHGRLHSVGGGNGICKLDAYPLELTGIIINLVPITSSVHAPAVLPVVNGYLLFDNLEVTSYMDKGQ